MSRPDALDIVELAYQLDVPTDAWLTEIARAFGARLEGSIAPSAYIVSRTDAGRIRIDAAFTEGVPNAKDYLQAMADTIDIEAANAIFPLGTDCGFFSESLSLLPDAQRDTVGAGTMMAITAAGGDDSFGIRCVDAAGRGICLGLLSKGSHVVPDDRRLFVQLASHIGAGARLRRTLEQESADARTEAIFEADGRLAHATGAATTASAREHLRRAVRDADRARLKRAREDEASALDLWQGLVEGRWSLIDRHDSDGRRYYVAVRNPPVAVRERALSSMEARVAALVAAGEPNKVIGYALGVAESTVSGYVTSVLRKLGAASRVELIQIARALQLDLSGGEEPAES